MGVLEYIFDERVGREGQMGTVKSDKVSSPPVKGRHSGRIRLRNSSTGEYIKTIKTIKEKKRIAQSSGKPLRVKRRTSNTPEKLPTKILNWLAEARLRAELLGKPVEVTIHVPPGNAELGIVTSPVNTDTLDDAMAAARQRGTERVAEILKQSDMLSGREFASLIGASPETVNQKRKTGDLLGLEAATRGVRYPKWQVTDDGRLLPGLRSIFDILGEDPWRMFRFLTQRHNELAGKTALDAMRAGDLEAVQNVARNMRAGVFA
jgi:hypothetical protein